MEADKLCNDNVTSLFLTSCIHRGLYYTCVIIDLEYKNSHRRTVPGQYTDISILGILYEEAIWVYKIDANKPLKLMHFKTKLSDALSTEHCTIRIGT